MSADWKSIVASVAPGIAGLLGGPGAGIAVKLLADKFLGNPNASASDVASAVATASPEDLVKLKQIEADLQKYMLDNALDLAKLSAQQDQAYLADTQDARKANAANKGTFWMGVFILLTFVVLMAAVLYGCFRMAMGGLLIKDPGTAAVIFTLIGTIVGYVASNAQTVVNFEFGTSRGSAKKSDDMADAVKALAGGGK